MADVVVQLGHCYRKRGSTGTAGEQDFARAAAAHTIGRLRAWGHAARGVLADETIPASDVFVAIHCDGSVNPRARGASVGHQDRNGDRLGEAWKGAYQAGGWTGGFRPDNYTAALAGYYGVRRARAAGTRFATICEAGFLTSPDDRALLANRAGHIRFAQAVVDAVGLVLTHPTPPKEDTVLRFIKRDPKSPDIYLVLPHGLVKVPNTVVLNYLGGAGNVDTTPPDEVKNLPVLTGTAAGATVEQVLDELSTRIRNG